MNFASLLSEKANQDSSKISRAELLPDSPKLPTIKELEEEDRARCISYLSTHRPDLAELLVNHKLVHASTPQPIQLQDVDHSSVKKAELLYIPVRANHGDDARLSVTTETGGISLNIPYKQLKRIKV